MSGGFTNLHLFSLPSELLHTLAPRLLISRQQQNATEVSEVDGPETQATAGVRTCNICQGAVFSDVDEQRSHFRSDWHRYNVKARLSNSKPVTEAEFANLLDGLEDSLSGSESSSEDDASDSDAVQTLLHKTRIKSRSPSPTAKAIPLTAVTWFHSHPATQIGVYRAVFSPSIPHHDQLAELKALQKSAEGRKWTMFMVAGGHFAGVIVRVSKPDDSSQSTTDGKAKQKKPVPEMEILHHKTFHRYTTRRKQGGSQSLNDNSKGNAKSAGAQLRRYGEQALRDDIRNLIDEWSEDISASERIWIRASGSNRKIFMDYDNAIISKGDERLRTFPFPTRRPTQAELSRCLMELTRVKITHFTEAELKEQDEAFLAALPKAKPQPVLASPAVKFPEKKVQKLSKEEEIFRDKWDRLLDMVKKGRLDALKAFYDREAQTLGGVDTIIPEWTGEKLGTLLQVASNAGQTEVVSWLLDDLKADPTIPVPLAGANEDVHLVIGNAEHTDSNTSVPAGTIKTAYDVASTRDVRDAFRRSAANLPDLWDWLGAGHIPSLLIKEKEDERESKKKERRKGLKDKIKSREVHSRDQSPVRQVEVAVDIPGQFSKPAGKPGLQRLGGSQTAGDGVSGLSPEMRAKIERERRARAAEARMKR